MKKLILIAALLITSGIATVKGQTYLYFQDSPTSEMYDFSWMELTSPSELERKGSDLRRFPVEETIVPAQGLNSLRLKWKSVAGGGWFAIAAGLDWTEKNLTDTDTLHFMIYSVEGIAKANLPLVFMEDINNIKTSFHSFLPYTTDPEPGVWTTVKIPMSVFLDAGDPVNFTKIKTIGFTQGAADAVTHTLLVDDMRVYKGTGVAPPADIPQDVTAVGYDSHIEVLWDPNTPGNLNGYQVQRSENGVDFQTVGMVTAADSGYVDWVKTFGYGKKFYYKVAAINSVNQISPYSDTTSAATRELTDEEFLDMVQQYTFRYFYDFAHPVSGLARERNTSGDVVTSGGSGFGVMALLVGIERGFITREQGIARMLRITGFLQTADRFHGVWPHWLNGITGDVHPFSQYDNGGDLVETAFLVQGLLAARQYFDGTDQPETEIRNRITQLWEGVEWDWYRKNNSNVLYWHWSPNYGWQINMQIRGWNEAAIIYILGVASPTHGIPGSLWTTGWAGSSYYKNGRSFYGYKLDVGWDYGGPLFFAHYSFQGFDPRSIKDQFTNYFNLNRNVTMIHRAYAISNPKRFPNYGENEWGFTASDDPSGYTVHEPTSSRDNGTITPTAALSSIPYTPEQSIAALKHMYRERGERIWGRMGFYDAYNVKLNWYADSYLAIDQGPIINMIENYRSELLWENFMANPEIQPALTEIGFVPDPNAIKDPEVLADISVYPNPADEIVKINLNLLKSESITISINDLSGKEIMKFMTFALPSGKSSHEVNVSGLNAGVYIVNLATGNRIIGSVKLFKTE